MAGLAPTVQADAWRLVSVDINRQCSSDISVIAEELLEPVCIGARVPVIFSIQETRSCDVRNLELPEYVCCGSMFGLATNSFAKLRCRGGLMRDAQQCSLKPLW